MRGFAGLVVVFKEGEAWREGRAVPGGGGCRLYFNVIIVAVATHWITPPGMNLVTMVGLREIGKCATEGYSYITANNSEGLTCDPSNYTDDTSVQLPPPRCEDVAIWEVLGGVLGLFGGTGWWGWGRSPHASVLPGSPERGTASLHPDRQCGPNPFKKRRKEEKASPGERGGSRAFGGAVAAGLGNKDLPGGWAGTGRPRSTQYGRHICGTAAGTKEQNPPPPRQKKKKKNSLKP